MSSHCIRIDNLITLNTSIFIKYHNEINIILKLNLHRNPHEDAFKNITQTTNLYF